MSLSLTLLAVLAQAPEPQPAAPTPAPSAVADPVPEPPPAPAPAPKPKLGGDMVSPGLNADSITRELERIKRLPPDEAAKAAEALQKRMPKNPEDYKRPAPVTLENMLPQVRDYANLPEAEQVKYSAREFFSQLIAGDAKNITDHCAVPFQLEERRLTAPEEVLQEWLRNLRNKRTDLLTLYDVEVLTPQDMEKKYGRPPARLQNLPWRAPKTYVAVANLSGHAAVAVFRHTGSAWAVVGYAD